MSATTIGEWLDAKGFVNIEDKDGIAQEVFVRAEELESSRVICGNNLVRVFFYQDNKAARFHPALVVTEHADYRLVWSS